MRVTVPYWARSVFLLLSDLLSELFLQISYHATSLQPRARWAIIFSGLRYIIIHIQHSSHRPTFYCSQIMTFCLRPGDSQVPDAQPPIWTLLVYMLLTETLDRSDEDLRQQLHLPVPLGSMSSPCLGTQSWLDARGHQSHLDMLAEVGTPFLFFHPRYRRISPLAGPRWHGCSMF
jgi:hypothetical protein